MYLHSKLGVNPKLTFCRRCGRETNELLLVGAHTGKYTCDNCGLLMLGGRPNIGHRCPRCGGNRTSFTKTGTIGERERLPASDLCDGCKMELESFKQIVDEGGVYWKCKDCHAEGVMKKSPYAGMVRLKLNIPIGPCGVEFSKDCGCPKCGDATKEGGSK